MATSNNPFGFFSPTNGQAAFRDLLSLLDDFAEANHKHLLTQYSKEVLTKAELLLPYHHARKKGTTSRFENYLQNFISAFKENEDLQSTATLYQKLLLPYQKTKENLNKLNAKQQPSDSIDTLVREIIEPFPQNDPFFRLWKQRFHALTQQPTEAVDETEVDEAAPAKQQIALDQLRKTLIHCINHHATKKSLAWHPSHHENYYLAKLKILWRNYTNQYGEIDKSNLLSTTTQSTIGDRKQSVITRHVESQHELEEQKKQFNQPRFQQEQQKLQQYRDDQLAEITSIEKQLRTDANDILTSAADISSPEAESIFTKAIAEIERKALSFASSPALFKLVTTGKRHNPHALATLKNIDELHEMKQYQKLFEEQYAEISAHAASPAAAAAAYK